MDDTSSSSYSTEVKVTEESGGVIKSLSFQPEPLQTKTERADGYDYRYAYPNTYRYDDYWRSNSVTAVTMTTETTTTVTMTTVTTVIDTAITFTRTTITPTKTYFIYQKLLSTISAEWRIELLLWPDRAERMWIIRTKLNQNFGPWETFWRHSWSTFMFSKEDPFPSPPLQLSSSAPFRKKGKTLNTRLGLGSKNQDPYGPETLHRRPSLLGISELSAFSRPSSANGVKCGILVQVQESLMGCVTSFRVPRSELCHIF